MRLAVSFKLIVLVGVALPCLLIGTSGLTGESALQPMTPDQVGHHIGNSNPKVAIQILVEGRMAKIDPMGAAACDRLKDAQSIKQCIFGIANAYINPIVAQKCVDVSHGDDELQQCIEAISNRHPSIPVINRCGAQTNGFDVAVCFSTAPETTSNAENAQTVSKILHECPNLPIDLNVEASWLLSLTQDQSILQEKLESSIDEYCGDKSISVQQFQSKLQSVTNDVRKAVASACAQGREGTPGGQDSPGAH